MELACGTRFVSKLARKYERRPNTKQIVRKLIRDKLVRDYLTDYLYFRVVTLVPKNTWVYITLYTFRGKLEHWISEIEECLGLIPGCLISGKF